MFYKSAGIKCMEIITLMPLKKIDSINCTNVSFL